ncbi:SDR family oxidoreductase [Salinibacterium sp.]|uniref:SDR family oxidoreductase n=1 Tax=Salinibacterium sp. TaxID=1915057 RepID=UPI00286B221A|nr:SDR family oxidoreductase [Salinibacterium sp.]
MPETAAANRPVAIVTGVGRTVGIGAAIAATLADQGWDLALNYWTPADEEIFGAEASRGLAELVIDLGDRGARVLTIPANLERVDAAAGVISTATARLGAASALVLSHAWDDDRSLLDTTVEQFDKHFAINTRASWLLVREFAGQIPDGGGASWPSPATPRSVTSPTAPVKVHSTASSSQRRENWPTSASPRTSSTLGRSARDG